VCLTLRSDHSTPKEGAPIPIEQGAVWALAPVRFLEKRKSLATTETRTPDRRVYVYARQRNYSLQRNEVVINHGVAFYKQSRSQKPHSFTSEHFKTLSTAPISYLVTSVTLELLETTKFQSWMSCTSLWAWSEAKFRKNLPFGSVFIIEGYKSLFAKDYKYFRTRQT